MVYFEKLSCFKMNYISRVFVLRFQIVFDSPFLIIYSICDLECFNLILLVFSLFKCEAILLLVHIKSSVCPFYGGLLLCLIIGHPKKNKN